MKFPARIAAACLAVALGASVVPVASAQVDTPVRTPRIDEPFGDYVTSTFADGRLATIDELVEPITTTHDPFYDEPALRGDEAPGTLLKAEPLDVQFTAVRPGNLRAWRTMYVTTERDGSAGISTGILMVPDDGRDDATRTVVGYQQANDSLGSRCHPSTQWTGATPDEPGAWSALGPLALMFERGWAVSISDVGNDTQAGPHGVFAGKYAANAMLDGIRSALTGPDIDLSPTAPMGLFGIAGGGVGASFAAERHDSYAPELNIKATVAEGMVVDQRNFITRSDNSLGAGFAFATLVGLAAKYPEMNFDDKLSPFGAQVADYYRGQCQFPAYFTLPFASLSSLFADGQSPATIPEFQHVYDDNLLGAGDAPSAPMLIASCGRDDSFMSLVPASDTQGLVDRYRATGATISYQPSDCSDFRLLTDPYSWTVDLFGMQTLDWFAANLDA